MTEPIASHRRRIFNVELLSGDSVLYTVPPATVVTLDTFAFTMQGDIPAAQAVLNLNINGLSIYSFNWTGDAAIGSYLFGWTPMAYEGETIALQLVPPGGGTGIMAARVNCCGVFAGDLFGPAT